MQFTRGPLGFDLSFWQDDNRTVQKVDFNKMKSFGAAFVICRAGQNLWQDEDFRDYWAAAKLAGLPRAAYFFYDPRVSPIGQAHLFASLVVNDKPEGRLWVDFEFPKSWGGAYVDWRHWKAFIEETRQLTGLRIGIYTAAWWWDDVAVNQGADFSYFGQFPLWVAQYTANAADVDIPRGWTKAMIWQYGTPPIGPQVGVESLEIDANYWNADFRFEDEWGGATVPPPPGGSMKYRVIWPNGVARRTGPSVSNTYTGLTYFYDQAVDVVEDNIPDREEPDNLNKRWVRFADDLYGASEYPNSIGVPQTRMVKIEEPQPAPEKEIVKGVLYFNDGSQVELFPTE
jgi:hypothetical protein